MTDEHKALTAEYEQCVKRIQRLHPSEADVRDAVWHILKRLGPPDAGEAADIATDDELFRD